MPSPIQTTAVRAETLRLLSLLHLASPALPIGAFAWSQGLGGAVEQGLVDSEKTLFVWLETILCHSLSCWDAPLLLRCAQAARNNDAETFHYWNALVFSGRETAELWQEEEQMGKALCRLLHDQNLLPAYVSTTETGYVAAFGVAANSTGAYREEDHANTLATAFLWSWLENQIAAACKAIPLGQTAAQSLLLQFMPLVATMAEASCHIADNELGASLHGLALTSTAHEQQYSRLFRS